MQRTRQVWHVDQELPTLHTGFLWVRVARYLVFCIVFCEVLFVLLFSFSFGHCLDFWLTLWHLQTFHVHCWVTHGWSRSSLWYHQLNSYATFERKRLIHMNNSLRISLSPLRYHHGNYLKIYIYNLLEQKFIFNWK